MVELALDLVEGAAGDQHAAGLGQGFEPGGDVDAIAQQIVAVDHDVAEVDADPVFDPLRGRPPGVAVRDRRLDLERGADRLDGARELGDRAVAGAAEHAAAVAGDQLLDQRPAGVERGERGSSSRAISRLKPTMSAARIAVIRRSI